MQHDGQNPIQHFLICGSSQLKFMTMEVSVIFQVDSFFSWSIAAVTSLGWQKKVTCVLSKQWLWRGGVDHTDSLVGLHTRPANLQLFNTCKRELTFKFSPSWLRLWELLYMFCILVLFCQKMNRSPHPKSLAFDAKFVRYPSFCWRWEILFFLHFYQKPPPKYCGLPCCLKHIHTHKLFCQQPY